MNKKKIAVISLSGGMDSSTLLLNLLDSGYEVQAVSFDYGQKHYVELERARELVEYIKSSIPNVLLEHQIISISGLSELLFSNLVKGGEEVPEGHYESENMKATVVPNRNKIFSSLIQAVALSIANRKGGSYVDIAMGIHAGDHAIYPDCREEFRNADYTAFLEGNWNGELVNIYTPYLFLNKRDILLDGMRCCTNLNLDFNEVYKKTNTSYKPLQYEGVWYSDYKSASSVERIEAFIDIDLNDPVDYADETGPVTWEVARDHVKSVLSSSK